MRRNRNIGLRPGSEEKAQRTFSVRPAYVNYAALRTAPWLLLGAILFGVVLLTPWAGDLLGVSSAAINAVQSLQIVASYAIIAAIICELFMVVIYLASLSYELNGGELLIAKGLMHRTATSVPLKRIAHVCVRRNANQMLFGLSSVDVHCPGNTDQRILSIDWLSKNDANQLQSYLSRFSAKEAEAELFRQLVNKLPAYEERRAA